MNVRARYPLNADEVVEVVELTNKLSSIFDAVDTQEFLNTVTPQAHNLPDNLRKFLNDFRLGHDINGYCVVSGYPVDKEQIGPTPDHWDRPATRSPSINEEMFLMLCSAILGDTFGWATQQDGKLVHDVLPIKGQEFEMIGFSSLAPLQWHTEDAFDSCRADHIAIMCLRNPDQTATSIGRIDIAKLSHEDVNQLMEPVYAFVEDDSHKRKNSGQSQISEADQIYDRYENDIPAPAAVLYGDRTSPFMRIDPDYMTIPPLDDPAGRALDAMIRSINDNLIDVALSPGDILFADNKRVVHGRRPFMPKYDGSDRWLKRINITKDLGKSIDRRSADRERIIL